MCGILGIWNLIGKPIKPELLSVMNNIQRHRGPDDEGYLLVNTMNGMIKNCYGHDTIPQLKKSLESIQIDFIADLAFGFRRLSIIDLSDQGHQPMRDASGRYWIIFNGEVYNFPEIRSELAAHGFHFRSGTDTEVILYSYIYWGAECLHRFNGMWAFCIYDAMERKLFCSRDRFGIKPFYYIYKPGEIFAFASEIKVLLHLISFEPEPSSIYDYFSSGITNHNSKTFFKDIQQLMPGNKLEFKENQLTISKYYKIPYNRNTLSFKQASERFGELFSNAISLRQRSDVPVGYALSGGLDSSSIVCMAGSEKNTKNDVTFSLIFPGKKEDESKYIRAVIQHTNFKSRQITIGPDDLFNDLEKFIFYQEEPFSGLSYYGEFKLRELIRNSNITVSLEGQGADEIITGYPSLIPFYFYDLIKDKHFVKFFREIKNFSNLTHFNIRSTLKAYLNFRYVTIHPKIINKYPFLQLEEPVELAITKCPNQYHSSSHLNNELFKLLDCSSIPEQLVRADKSAMAFSVECRFPFLDYRLVEFAMNLPYDYKIKDGKTKYILRETMRPLLPELIYQRKDKIGFAVPASEWTNRTLFDMMQGYLSDGIGKGFINLKLFNQTYSDCLKIDWKFWKVMSLLMWKYEFSEFKKNHIAAADKTLL